MGFLLSSNGLLVLFITIKVFQLVRPGNLHVGSLLQTQQYC
jgi:hypothetical protein